MRCLGCQYDLRNLTEHRCPECGREFDPSDPATFAPEPLKNHPSVAIMLLLVLGIFVAAAVVHLYQICVDTTVQEFVGASADWPLGLQLIAAGFRALATTAIFAPLIIVGYLLLFFIKSRIARI